MESKSPIDTANDIKKIEQPGILSGIFDVYKEAIRTHTNGSKLTADYTLSNLNVREHTFIVEQEQVAMLFSEYIPEEEEAHKCYNFIMSTVHNIAILSRAREAKVLNAILGLAHDLAQPPEAEEEEKKEEKKK